MARALIFDSGVGGLSVVAEIRKRLPNLRLTYAADDEFRPYGDKSEDALRVRLPGLISTLAEAVRPDVIVIACNTASTSALPGIRAAAPCPVIGVVPAIKPAAAKSRTKTIGVLGTPGTVRRRYVDGLINDFASDCHVVLQGSVGLVALAEAKLVGEPVKISDVRAEIAALFSGRQGVDIDAVVLACTHFPLLKEELQKAVTQSVMWVDSGAAVAKYLETVLGRIDTFQPAQSGPDTALLIGPETSAARRKAFAKFGFEKVVSLKP